MEAIAAKRFIPLSFLIAPRQKLAKETGSRYVNAIEEHFASPVRNTGIVVKDDVLGECFSDIYLGAVRDFVEIKSKSLFKRGRPLKDISGFESELAERVNKVKEGLDSNVIPVSVGKPSSMLRSGYRRVSAEIVEAVKVNRKKRGVGLKRLARYLKCSRDRIRRLEKGQSQSIHMQFYRLYERLADPSAPAWEEMAGGESLLKMLRSVRKPKRQISYSAPASKESFVLKEQEAGFGGQTSRNIAAVVDLSYRQEKFRVRKALLELLKKHTEGDISALTLPGTEWLLERDIVIYGLSAGRKTDVTGVEKDRQTYHVSRLNMEVLQSASPKSSIQFLHSDMEDFLHNHSYYKSAPANYNFVWLDWMGYVCKSHLASYWEVLKNLRLPAVVACTFMRAREHEEEKALYGKCLRAYGAEIPDDHRAVSIPMMLTSLAARKGLQAEIVMNDHYIEEGKRTPMAVVALKIRKNKIYFKRRTQWQR